MAKAHGELGRGVVLFLYPPFITVRTNEAARGFRSEYRAFLAWFWPIYLALAVASVLSFVFLYRGLR